MMQNLQKPFCWVALTMGGINSGKVYCNFLIIFFWLFFRFETQLREEEESYQQQRRRLYNEIEEEKERFAQQTIQIKKEFDDRRNAYETSAKQTLTAALEDHERKLKELQKNHEVSVSMDVMSLGVVIQNTCALIKDST